MAGANQRLFVTAARETVEATRQEMIAVAKREHRKVMADDPKPTQFVRTVDGVRGPAEEKVRANGVIEYVYSRLSEIVAAAMDTLFDLSPVLSGEYRMAHRLFVDGVEARNLADWNGVSEIVIANLMPYARKIELGKMTMEVPGTSQVYEQAEFLLQERFGNQARIFMTFRGFVGGAIATGAKGNKADLRYPILVIRGP